MKADEELQFPSKETIHRLTKELGLEGAAEFTQDWEYEVADVNQLPQYINFYKTKKLNVNEKSTLMRIMLESYNDYIGMHHKEDKYGDIIEDLLENEYDIHQETIKYWGCENDNLEDCFAITPFMRAIRDRVAYDTLQDIEQKYNICLPEKYKQLYNTNFAGTNGKIMLQIKEEIFCIKHFLTATEIINLLEEFYDFWGYDIVPIAELEYGDYICFYYKTCRKNPIIVYWNYELALENPDVAMLFLYENMEEFEIGLSNKYRMR